MPFDLKISVTGGNKLPVSFTNGEHQETFYLYGPDAGQPEPAERLIYNIVDPMSLEIGPEEPI